jgi:signal peptidase I
MRACIDRTDIVVLATGLVYRFFDTKRRAFKPVDKKSNYVKDVLEFQEITHLLKTEWYIDGKILQLPERAKLLLQSSIGR